MTESKHTSGTLEFFPARNEHGEETFSIRGGAEFIAMMDTVAIGSGPFHAPANAKANARRIVACWNACQNISTEALESGALAGLRQIK